VQISGTVYASKLLEIVEFATSEALGPDASEHEIQAPLDRHKLIIIKPPFKGGRRQEG
jgi:hypothetical protein